MNIESIRQRRVMLAYMYCCC